MTVPCSPQPPDSDQSSLALGASTSVISDREVSSNSGGINNEIPKLWQPDVNTCISEKSLTDSTRDEIVRRLVDNLFSKSVKPTRNDCVEIARKLIMAYPWMRDDVGIGPSYVSCVCSHYVTHIIAILLLTAHMDRKNDSASKKCYKNSKQEIP